MATIEKVGGQGAASGRKKERSLFSFRTGFRSSLIVLITRLLPVTDRACHWPCSSLILLVGFLLFLIVPSDRDPGTGYKLVSVLIFIFQLLLSDWDAPTLRIQTLNPPLLEELPVHCSFLTRQFTRDIQGSGMPATCTTTLKTVSRALFYYLCQLFYVGLDINVYPNSGRSSPSPRSSTAQMPCI